MPAKTETAVDNFPPDMSDEVAQQKTQILTVQEVALLLRKSPRTIREWAQSGQIKARKIGRDWFFNRTALFGELLPEESKQPAAA